MAKLIGNPVIVHEQVKDSLMIFWGLALRDECDNKKSISIVRVSGKFGQNEQLEIIHNIEHFSKRISACYWIYPEEIELMYDDFKSSWDKERKQEKIKEIAEYLGLLHLIEDAEEQED